MISLVIVTFNSVAVIGRCLNDFIELAGPVLEDVVVVDNASSDGTQEVAASFGDRVRLVQNEANVGYGSAANIGADHTRGDWLAVANPDVRQVSFVPELLAQDVADPAVGALSFGLIDSSAGRVVYPLYRHVSPLREVIAGSWGLARPAGRFQRRPVARPFGGRRRVWLSGGFFAVRRSAWDAVGGFDERFFLYYEDADLSRRLVDAGFLLRPSSAFIAVHDSGTSSPQRDAAWGVAWSLASWLTYVRIWDGPRAARVAAIALRANLALLQHSLEAGALARPADPRFARKITEVAELRAIVRRGMTPAEGDRASGPDRPDRAIALALSGDDDG